MKPEHYKLLCNSCDRLLKDPKAGAYRISIPWLHIVREHPHFLQQYEYLFGGQHYQSKFSGLKRSARHFASWAFKLMRSIRSFRTGIIDSTALPPSADVLIVSHLINPAHLQHTKDFYFDELPQYLATCGFKVVVALINHTGRKFSKDEISDQSTYGFIRLVLADSMDIGSEVTWLRAAWAESRRLTQEAQQAQDTLTVEIARRAAVEALSGSAHDSYRLGEQVSTLAKILKPRALLTTFEGHAWERTVFSRVRSAYPPVHCLAYQHAALFRLQHGLRRSLGNLFDPDIIFTSGEAAREQLLELEAGGGPILKVLGSNRSAVNSNQIPDKPPYQKEDDSSLCLVLLDGFESDALLMLDFAIRCATELPEMTFLLRLHPITHFADLIKRLPKLRQVPSNIVCSADSLENDAYPAAWVLYRGTTAVVSAVQFGAIPIYLKVEGEMTCDPLYAFGNEREVVSMVGDFVECVSTELRQETIELRRALVAQHCKEIFSPLNFKVVADYLEKLPDARLACRPLLPITLPSSSINRSNQTYLPISMHTLSKNDAPQLPVSIVIATLGGASLIDTISQVNKGSLRPSEILVCIPEKEAFRASGLLFDNVRVVPTQCRGQVAQRAVGFGLASSPLVMQLDDDIRLEIDTLEKLVSALLALGPGHTVGPVFYNAASGLPLTPLTTGIKGFFVNIYETSVRGLPWGTRRMGALSTIGACGGVDPRYCNGDVYRTAWLPGGCSITFRENLVMDSFFPYQGKAYSEDVLHSFLRKKLGVTHFVALAAKATILPPERGVSWRTATAEIKARLYVAQMLGGGRVRAVTSAALDILRRQLAALLA